MRPLRALALAAALAGAAATAAPAQLSLDAVRWQIGKVARGRVSWADGRLLAEGPPKLASRLRARLVLRNKGTAPVEGVLLRYSMTARLVPSASPEAAGTWAIPFSVDERRVPVIGAGKTIDVPLESAAALDLYLRHLARAGWWPDRIKLQVMLDPRPGSSAIQTVEDVLEVRH